ncbi:hypothetical protein [Ochrobactrum sp. SFR4]|uniref:hypothetical protein n=1 Tax=Ochrobactrum sp. SFR4 TaxID=2717368 RepID=UPI001C8BECA9|nr:hypothetical protein [Ochrobactrum sp. SFR4]MBX8825244.1 hypothetical protein [Ochrobactrum sp. SFR4]
MRGSAILALTALLSACQSTPNQPTKEDQSPPRTRDEFCAKAGAFLNDQWASDWQKMAMYERMRNAGCMN